MRNFEKSKRRTWLTTGELISVISNITKRRVDLKEAKMRVAELFEVTPERKELKDGKVTVYNIGHRLTLTKIIENAAESCPKNAANLRQKQGKICRIDRQPKTLKMSELQRF